MSIGHFLPLIVFFILLLTGFSIPLSEDLIIITSALIAEENPYLLFPLHIAIFLGVVAADHISYWIGFHFGHKIKNIKRFKRTLSERRILIIQKYLNKYGIFTFIVCRFIPFGVRNTLFLSSGFSKMKYRLFTIYELTAALISTSTLYYLIYFLGISAEKNFKIIGIVLFCIFVVALITIILKFIVFKRRKPKIASENTTCSAK
jgi:membrane protein DedA with SNARE-associated domain